ncbi:hypothetical protein J1605_018065 [Eschrichtius robustus]|uniref:General transcription factor 3C polypeptide 2 n=1 Tax=Eschrichtius robustus TaxID=9764 RepID=A0AB34HVM8_ESCRO|nr:hypothetical protein J1605_018065 [Eschrichtius robustus]
MDPYGVGCVALEEAGPVGNMTVVDSPGQEVLNQLDVKASSETTSVEASIETSLPTPLPGFEDSLDERRLPPEQETLSRLEQQDLSSEMSKVPKPRASKPGPKRGDQSNPLSTPMPKKRGRKSKADLLLLKLSKGLDQPESPHPKRPPEDFETPPGERPRRRAAQVALLYLQELAEELSTALPAPVSCPESPKVSSPTKPKKSQQQAACHYREEEDDTARDEDFVLQVEAEDGEEMPEGAAASQYVALFSSPDMNETHPLSQLHSGPGLLQLWDLGTLQQESCPDNRAHFVYGIACDHGCIWDLKFCPSGAWELPGTPRKAPLLPRLGLLALACSDGKVLLFSLPHPEALLAQQPLDAVKPAIYKVQCVATLQVGSMQASDPSECGMVVFWNLPTNSPLQRIRLSDGSLKLYPFQCFLAHDQAVRTLQWCKANSHFLVSAGSDRKIKFWDLRRPYEPINSIKRFLSTELAWLLPYNGVTVAQDNCYASYGLCGIHYIDAGYLGFKAYFTAPRKGTVWSLSGSDWLGTIAAGDISGELIAAILPDMALNPINVKRPVERRFPIYKADLMPYQDSPEGQDHSSASSGAPNPPKARTYAETVNHHYLLFQDTDLGSFHGLPHREPILRMQEGEGQTRLCLDRLQLEAIHKVRFSPNLDSYGWLVSGGQSGLVRIHFVRALTCPLGHRMQLESRAHFNAMFQLASPTKGPGFPPTSHRLLPGP